MKSKFLIIAVVLLLLAGGGYFYFNKSKGGPAGGVTSGVKSLKELLAANVPQKCTFSSNDDSGKSEGTSYIAGGKVRADISSTQDGKATTSHMITDNKTSYIWEEGSKDGFKMTITEGETKATSLPEGEETSSQQSEADLSQQEDYKCSAWVPDNSLFTPPSNVKFTDFSEMFKTPAPGSSGNSQQCSVCESLTGNDKASCLSALNCK